MKCIGDCDTALVVLTVDSDVVLCRDSDTVLVIFMLRFFLWGGESVRNYGDMNDSALVIKVMMW